MRSCLGSRPLGLDVWYLGVTALLLCGAVKWSRACDIVSASACPPKPDIELKEKSLAEYCEAYKQNLECVYQKYSGCEEHEMYATAMKSMQRALRIKVKQILQLCIEHQLEIDVPIDTGS